MKSEDLARVRTGVYAQIILYNDIMLSGYIGSDPAQPELLRFDSFLPNDYGQLQEISLKLEPGDLINVHILHDPPEFSDTEGNNVRLPNGFFPHLK
ncbi:MAG: hypothetical protein LBH01_08150 [Verrucomicrobiales bacterium]|nr:hypothetical protein [Verrucomicrobiales bacterium]